MFSSQHGNYVSTTAALWIGGVIAGLTYGKVTNIIGRRYALFWAAIITIFSVVLQTASQDAAMFVIGRILVAYWISASTLAGPTYLAETLPYQWRGWGLGMLNDCYYIGIEFSVFGTFSRQLIQYRRADCCWHNLLDRNDGINPGLAHSECNPGNLQYNLHHDPTHSSQVTSMAHLCWTPKRSACGTRSNLSGW